MRRWAAGLVLAGLALLVATAGAQAAGDLVAAEPHEGDEAAYEGYESVYTTSGGLLDKRSLDHQRTWTTARFPLPSGGQAELVSLQHRYPVPDPPASSGSGAPEGPALPTWVDLIGEADGHEGPVVSRDVIEMDAHHEQVPAPPSAFSMAHLDQHEEETFWRIFRLHGIGEGWCARSPAGAFAGLPSEEAPDRARACLSQAPWGEVLEADVSVRQDTHADWGETWLLVADLDYRSQADARGEAHLEVRFSPQVSMELERTLARWDTGGDEPVLRVRHVEMTGFERGQGSLSSQGLPDQARVEDAMWTPDGVESPWDPALGFQQAREAVEGDPRVEAYRMEEPQANLTYAQFTRVNADERSSPASAGVHPGNCENARAPATDLEGAPPEASWSFFLSGENEDLIALAERRDGRELAGQTLERPARTETTRFASPGSSPELGLPRLGPDPGAMFDHVDAADELDAQGDPFVAVFPPGEEGSTGVAEDDPLLGAAGRMRCSLDPLGTYSYENVGIAFREGKAAGVYSLRVEAVQDEGLGVAQLPAPPTDDDADSTLSGTGLAGLALGATGVAGWAGTRMLGSLYSRLKDRELLDHEIRAELYETIRSSPGLCLAEIAEDVDRHRSTIAYHLDKLEEGGFLETRATPSGRIAFPAEHPLLDASPTLARGRARELVTLVRRDPGRALSDYAGELGVSKSYLSRLAPELEEAGLLERRREGRRLLLEPGPRAALLAE